MKCCRLQSLKSALLGLVQESIVLAEYMMIYQLNIIPCHSFLACKLHNPTFSPDGVRETRKQLGAKIALCFLCLFVCLFVHLHLSRAQYITSYVTMQL